MQKKNKKNKNKNNEENQRQFISNQPIVVNDSGINHISDIKKHENYICEIIKDTNVCCFICVHVCAPKMNAKNKKTKTLRLFYHVKLAQKSNF